MIYTTKILEEKLANYGNPKAKIAQLVRKGELTRVARGFYESDPSTPAPYLAQVIYGPSYISFEYALAYFDMIPERVERVTCATLGKHRVKRYDTSFGTFTYRDVPTKAFPLHVSWVCKSDRAFLVAQPEKALCDLVYTMPPASNQTELGAVLEGLRLDEEALCGLRPEVLAELAEAYANKSVRLLARRAQRGWDK